MRPTVPGPGASDEGSAPGGGGGVKEVFPTVNPRARKRWATSSLSVLL